MTCDLLLYAFEILLAYADAYISLKSVIAHKDMKNRCNSSDFIFFHLTVKTVFSVESKMGIIKQPERDELLATILMFMISVLQHLKAF
jgi:hypothetical protein